MKLTAVIEVITDAAERSIDRVKGKVNTLSGTTESSSQKQQASWGRVEAAIGIVTAAAAGFVASMVANSPSLAAALSEISFAFDEVAMAVGEAVAPAVEALVPIVQSATDWFLSLGTEVHATAGAFAVATAGGGALIGVLGVLGVSVGALLSPVLIVIAAITALTLAWTTNFGGIRDVTAGVVSEISDYFSQMVAENTSSFEAIATAVRMIWDVVSPVLNAIASLFFTVFGQSVVAVIKTSIDILGVLAKVVGGVAKMIIGAFTGDWDMAWSGVVDVLKGIINLLITGINAFIRLVNVPFKSLKDWDILPEWIRNDIPVIPEIPKFHQGGIVPGTPGQEVLAVLQAGERVVPRNRVRESAPTIVNNYYTLNASVRNDQDIRGIERMLHRNQRRTASGRG